MDIRQNDGSPNRPSAQPPSHPPRSVESIGEHWRVDDEWWRQPLKRRYFDIILEGGKHVVLYEDELTHEWFEQMP